MTILKLSLTSFFWATLLFLGKISLSGMSIASVSAWRFMLAAIILVPVIFLREGLDRQSLVKHWRLLIAMSLIGIVAFNLALFAGVKHSSVVNTALIMGLCPVMITFLSAVLAGERITHQVGLGLLLSVSGAALVISEGSLSRLAGLNFKQGDLYVLFAAGCWAIYSALPRRFMPEVASTQITAVTISVGALLIAFFAAMTEPDFYTLPSISVASSIIAMSVFGTVVVFLWWNAGVSQIGPQKAAPFMNIVPLFAMLIGYLLGETISAEQIIGGLLVVAGVAFSLKAPSRAVV